MFYQTMLRYRPGTVNDIYMGRGGWGGGGFNQFPAIANLTLSQHLLE